MAKEETIDGLTLMDYKEMERESTTALQEGYRMVKISKLILANIEDTIESLGGKTAEQENEDARKARNKPGDCNLDV